jgi:hypothetical protein
VFIVIFIAFIIMFNILNTNKWNQSEGENNLVSGGRNESVESVEEGR